MTTEHLELAKSIYERYSELCEKTGTEMPIDMKGAGLLFESLDDMPIGSHHPYKTTNNEYIVFRAIPSDPTQCLLFSANFSWESSLDRKYAEQIETLLETVTPPWDLELAELMENHPDTMGILERLHTYKMLVPTPVSSVRVSLGEDQFIMLTDMSHLLNGDPNTDLEKHAITLVHDTSESLARRKQFVDLLTAIDSNSKPLSRFERLVMWFKRIWSGAAPETKTKRHPFGLDLIERDRERENS